MRATNGIPLGSPLPLTGWHCKLRPNTEGAAPDEHDIELLPDGQLLIVARVGVFTPLFMARSADNGRSWYGARF